MTLFCHGQLQHSSTVRAPARGAARTCPATHLTQRSASSDLPSCMLSANTSPAKPSSAPLQLAAPAFCSVPGSSSDPTASFGFLTSLLVSSSRSPCYARNHEPTPCPRGKKLHSHLPRDNCNLSQAPCQQAGSQSEHIRACQMQTYSSSYSLHYTSSSTFPSVGWLLLLLLPPRIFQSPFLLPNLSLLLHSIALYLPTLANICHLPRASLPTAVSWVCPHTPTCCTATRTPKT